MREAFCGYTLLTMNSLSRWPCDGFGDHLLGAAVAVHLGGVDQRHAQLDAELQRRRLGLRGAAALAHVPGSLAERRNLGPVRQSYCAHHAATLLGDPQHAQEIAAPERGDLLPIVAAPQQFGRDVRALRGVAPAGEPAAAVKIRGDADMLDADPPHRVVDVVGEVGDRDRLGLGIPASGTPPPR